MLLPSSGQLLQYVLPLSVLKLDCPRELLFNELGKATQSPSAGIHITTFL